MMNISKISVFVSVVEHQGFAAAARSLGMTGPALSKKVQALEDRLGVKLLHRTTRQISLTEEGAIYYERARRALEDLEEAEKQIQELKSAPIGLLKINVPMSFGVQYLRVPIVDFAKKYPDVEIDVDFDDRRVDVVGERYDVVVRIGALEDSSLIARKLAPCPILLCASPAYVEIYGLPKQPEDLAGFPAIVYNRHGYAPEWRYRGEDGSSRRAMMHGVMSANSAEMMLSACLEGIGIAILPVFSAYPYLQDGRLVQVLPHFATDPVRSIYAMFPQNRYLSTKTRLFVDWLSSACKDLPWVDI